LISQSDDSYLVYEKWFPGENRLHHMPTIARTTLIGVKNLARALFGRGFFRNASISPLMRGDVLHRAKRMRFLVGEKALLSEKWYLLRF
jgi:hypothetical protein